MLHQHLFQPLNQSWPPTNLLRPELDSWPNLENSYSSQQISNVFLSWQIALQAPIELAHLLQRRMYDPTQLMGLQVAPLRPAVWRVKMPGE